MAGTTTQAAEHADPLSLTITTEVAALVLGHIGQTGNAKLTAEQTKEAINWLFPYKFIEPST